MSKMIICGKECEDCVNAQFFENKKIIKVFCEAKNKEYYYGQRVPCESYEKYEKGESNERISKN